MKGGSLKRRLLAAGATSILVALAVAGLGLLLLFEWHVERRIARELESHLRQLVSGLSRGADGTLDISTPLAEPRFQEPLSGLYWQVGVEPNGPVLRSRSLWDASLQLPPDRLDASEVHHHNIPGPGRATLLAVERSVTLPEHLGGGTVRAVVALDRMEIHVAGLAFVSDLVPSLALLAAFLFTAAWVQVAVGLKPLDALRRRLAEVRAGRTTRLGAEFPDEVRPLANEFDHLLEAQDKAIARARARAADLAHGLKTPLTIMASDAEELRSRGETDIADEISTVVDGMRRHVDRELARARAGIRARTGLLGPVRPAVDQVVGVLRRTPRGQGLHWQIEVADNLAARVDPQDLTEIMGNLAENAAKWASAKVRVAAHSEADAVVLEVEDDGPGVPEDRRETALTRGGRLDETQPGSGLGLAIAGDLVEAYGGTLSLATGSLGGLGAQVRFPI